MSRKLDNTRFTTSELFCSYEQDLLENIKNIKHIFKQGGKLKSMQFKAKSQLNQAKTAI